MSEPITFVASFPQIQSAIKIDGAGGARIQLDVPESEMGNFITAMMWRGMNLKVTIEPLINNKDQYAIQEGRKRKSNWTTA